MIITFLAGNLLCEPRPPEASHLLRIKTTKIHRLADVAVGFVPWFAYFENFDCREFVSPAFHDVGGTLQQPRALFERRPAPFTKCRARSFDGAFGFGNSCFSGVSDNLSRLTGINRWRQIIGPNFFATDDERMFLTEAFAHFAQCALHLVLAVFVNEIHKRRVLVNIAGRGLKGSAIFTIPILRCSRDRLVRRNFSGGGCFRRACPI